MPFVNGLLVELHTNSSFFPHFTMRFRRDNITVCLANGSVASKASESGVNSHTETKDTYDLSS